MILSMIRLKSIGLSESPCLTPFFIIIGLDVWLFDRIRAVVSVFSSLITFTICSGTSFSLKHYSIGQFHPIKSFCKIDEAKVCRVVNSMDFSAIWCTMKIASVVDRFFRKPYCSSLGCIYCKSLRRITLVNSFRVVFNSGIPRYSCLGLFYFLF